MKRGCGRIEEVRWSWRHAGTDLNWEVEKKMLKEMRFLGKMDDVSACDGCKKKFCLNHHKPEAHACPVPPRNDKYVPVCPLCQQVKILHCLCALALMRWKAITIKPGEDPNAVVDRHIRAGCPTVVVNKKKQNACSFKGCKEKVSVGSIQLAADVIQEFVPVSCKLCKQPFCLKHRFETDHNCPAKSLWSPISSCKQWTPSQQTGQPPQPEAFEQAEGWETSTICTFPLLMTCASRCYWGCWDSHTRAFSPFRLLPASFQPSPGVPCHELEVDRGQGDRRPVRAVPCCCPVLKVCDLTLGGGS
eukprot:746853-Hanusia_phi.AAC.1